MVNRTYGGLYSYHPKGEKRGLEKGAVSFESNDYHGRFDALLVSSYDDSWSYHEQRY